MNKTTAIMALLGGIILVYYAIRMLIKKVKVLKAKTKVIGRIVGFERNQAIYKFTYKKKSMRAHSLQKVRPSSSKLQKKEELFFDPNTPEYVVIAGNYSIEMNSLLMIFIGLFSIIGGIIGILYY